MKLAEALNESGKQQLVYFLQSRTKTMFAPIRAIDEIQVQKQKASLVCPHWDSHFFVRFGKYVIKTRAGEVKQQRYRCKACHKPSTTSQTRHFNEPEDHIILNVQFC